MVGYRRQRAEIHSLIPSSRRIISVIGHKKHGGREIQTWTYGGEEVDAFTKSDARPALACLLGLRKLPVGAKVVEKEMEDRLDNGIT